MSKPTLRLHRPSPIVAETLGTTMPLHETGHGTHLTLLYFDNVKRGYEQDRLKNLADDFIKESDLCINYMDLGIDFENPEMLTDRSVLVKVKIFCNYKRKCFSISNKKNLNTTITSLHIDFEDNL